MFVFFSNKLGTYSETTNHIEVHLYNEVNE